MVLVQDGKSPFELLADWPRAASAASEISKSHHEWIRCLAQEIVDLKKQVSGLSLVVEEQKKMLIEKDKLIGKFSDEKAAKKPLFSSLFVSKTKPLSREEVNILAGVSNERKEIEKKESNLVVFGLKESNAADIEERGADDTKMAKEVLGALGFDGVVKSVWRLKKRKPAAVTNELDMVAERPAPVVVELVKSTCRMEILKKARILNGLEPFKGVFVRPDMTPAQREVHRQLVKTRDEKNAKIPRSADGKFNGNHYYGIRGGEVVKIDLNKKEVVVMSGNNSDDGTHTDRGVATMADQ